MVEQNQVYALFQYCDRDQNGFLDRTEIQYLAAALGRLMDNNDMDQLMMQLDANGDGWVTFEEFNVWYQNVGQYAQQSMQQQPSEQFAQQEEQEEDSDGEHSIGEDFDGEEQLIFDKKTGLPSVKSAAPIEESSEDEGGEFVLKKKCGDLADVGFGAVKPWIGQVAEPYEHNPVNKSKPDQRLELEYCYGYSVRSRQNVYFNAEGNAVYNAAALGVILETSSNTQTFFGGGETVDRRRENKNQESGHNDDVLALTVSKDRTIAVSGQNGPSPTMFAWDSSTGEIIRRFELPRGAMGVNGVSISADNKYVVAVDKSTYHNVHMFSMATGNSIRGFPMKGDSNVIYDISFSQREGEYKFCTTGVRHCYFWDKNGTKKRGTGAGTESHCVNCWDDSGNAYTGGQSGAIYYYANGGSAKKISAHKGFVCAIRWADDQLFTGAADGIRIWSTGGGPPRTTSTRNDFDGTQIRAIDSYQGMTLVGLKSGTIFLDQGNGPEAIMKSHNQGEVWGLAVVDEGKIVTSGDDNQVLVWDTDEHRQVGACVVSNEAKKLRRKGASTLSNLPDSQCSRCVLIHDGTPIIAANDGKVHIGWESDQVLTDAKEWIQCMSVSPCGQYLAVGSHDNMIYIYDIDAGYQKVSRCYGHHSFITALDWSSDSTYLRTNSGDYELLFWTMPDGKQDTHGRSNTRGTQWATRNVMFSWHVNGIFPSGEDGSHINSVTGSEDGQYLATGDDFCLVRLFNDPCVDGSQARAYRAHGEHVTNVKFCGDKLFSTGGYDQSIMQWRIV